MAIPGSEFVGDELHVSSIGQKVQAGNVPIIIETIHLQYDTVSAYSANDLVTYGQVAIMVGNAAPAPTTLQFLSTDPYPVIYGGATALLAPYGGVPTFIVRETQAGPIYKYRNDVQPVFDTVADTLTIDMGMAMDGDLTIKV
jgi:hypothetical protein